MMGQKLGYQVKSFFLFCFFIYFSKRFVHMNTDLQPNLQYITYDIIHMFIGEQQNNKMLFSRKNVFTKNNYKMSPWWEEVFALYKSYQKIIPGQILGNSCLHSRGQIGDPILINLAQNVCLSNIWPNIWPKFEYGLCQVKN